MFIIISVLCYTVISAEVTYNTINNKHLKYKNVQKLCETKHITCQNGGGNLCAVRKNTSNTFEYKNFDNSCYLYLSNVCLYYEQEFAIVSDGDCERYLTLRRHGAGVVTVYPLNTNTRLNNTNSTDTEYEYYYSDENTTEFQSKKAVREDSEESHQAYDYHPCPESCTDAYDPICLSVNRGVGMYFKFYTFVNHCEGDKYYCSHRNEFIPPPDESDEMVRSSMLSWSYCGSHRYLQFARFAEVASSLGYHGWLKTDERYAKIMNPVEHAFDA